MPLFSDKFNPRLSKPRKSTGGNNLIGRSSFGEENVDSLTEFKTLSIQLSDSLNIQFDESKGEWKTNYLESEDNHGNQEDDDDNGNNYHDDDNDDKVKRKSEISKEINSTSVFINSKSELAKLKKANETLLEENRLLKLKVELLVDLVIEKGESND